jgi:pseudouridine-5'-phosphate glycosidase
MIAAHMAGIRVFATGGIGGVHRGHPFDVSADLIELGARRWRSSAPVRSRFWICR